MDDTICSIATSLGIGAISIIRVSGKEAIKIVNQIFKGKNLEKVNSHTINYGYIVNKEEIIDEPWAPYVSSAIVFGRCHKIADEEENYRMVIKFASKYYPDIQMATQEADAARNAVQMYKIDIEHISGKKVQEK